MRLVLGILVLANIRWATAAHERAARLFREGDAAMDQAAQYIETAKALAERCHHAHPRQVH